MTMDTGNLKSFLGQSLIFPSSEKTQVGRVNTCRLKAAVVYVHALWDRTVALLVYPATSTNPTLAKGEAGISIPVE